MRLVLMVALTEPLSHLFEMQGGLGLTLVKEAEATSLPTGAFAVPFSTADVALAAVDEAVDVGTACCLSSLYLSPRMNNNKDVRIVWAAWNGDWALRRTGK